MPCESCLIGSTCRAAPISTIGPRYALPINEEVRPLITEIFEDGHRSYGYRRIQTALNRRRVFISEKVVRRLMKQAGHIAARPKRRRYRSYVGNQSRPRKPHQSRFSSDGSQRKVTHGHIGIAYPGREGLPVADDRLFRWHGRLLVDWHKSGC